MSQQRTIDHRTLRSLEERLKRGIPKWEQEHFIEQVVPQLLEDLRAYMELDINSVTQDRNTIEFPHAKRATPAKTAGSV